MKVNRWQINRLTRNTIVLVCSLVFAFSANAQRNIYIEASLGGISAPDTAFQSSSNDLSSVCDEYINPSAPNIDRCNYEDAIGSGGWQSHFSSSNGLSGGIEFGFNIHERARVSIDISRGSAAFDQTVASTDGMGEDFDKLIGELETAEESIANANSQEIFFWLFGDLQITRYWILSGGLGIGASNHSYELSWDWTRHSDPNLIQTGTNEPNADEIKQNLAGTYSRGEYEIKDRLFGYGISASVSRLVGASTQIGLEGSWRGFNKFQSPPYAAGVLRGHEPNLRLDGSQPVATWSDTPDTERTHVGVFVRQYF